MAYHVNLHTVVAIVTYECLSAKFTELDLSK